MRSPNQHHCNTEVLITYTKVFLLTPGRTRGLFAAKAPMKNAVKARVLLHFFVEIYTEYMFYDKIINYIEFFVEFK